VRAGSATGCLAASAHCALAAGRVAVHVRAPHDEALASDLAIRLTWLDTLLRARPGGLR